MPSRAGVDFIRGYVAPHQAVLEVGSRRGGEIDVRDEIDCDRFVGVDVFPGPGVDELCRIEHLVERFGSDSFDVVIAGEVLEHVRDWRLAISNLKRVAPVVLVTTRSRGYPFHVSPFDFWRYEPDDMEVIFDDMSTVRVERDPDAPGVFVAAKRGGPIVERATADIALYSILRERRCLDITDRDVLRKGLSSPRRVVSFVLPVGVKARIWASLPEPVRSRLIAHR